MADYDVQPLALSSPPQPAYVTSYRPAVSVRNNGVHDAYAAGLLRIYTAGQLIFTTQILSGNIAPGQSKDALGLEYWTPPAPGTYMCFAHVTCEHDQVPSNDNLAPVTFSVSGLPPPPPPGVTAHATQHEEGAADEIDLDGMRGLLEDPQTAAAHAATHQEAGDDELDVTGLHGALADPQPTANHANERHTTPFATVTNLTDHIAANPAHQLAANLEHVENKGAPSGYASLDLGAKVPAVQLGGPLTPSPDSFLRQDRTWTKPPTQIHAPTHESGGDDELSVTGLHGQLGDLQPVAAHHDSHAAGGSDELSVAGLQGVLAEPQVPSNHTAVAHDTSVEATAHKGAASGYAPLGLDAKVPVANLPGMPPTAHAATHQDGGSDELSIAGLAGKAADAQTPLNHGATHGNQGGDDISIGGLSGMPAAAGVPLGLATLDIDRKLTAGQAPPGLQPTSEKGQADGYCPLGPDTKVPSVYLPPSPPPATTGLELLHYVPVEYTFSNPNELSHDFGHFLVPNLAEGSIVTVDAYGTFQSPMASDVITLLINEPGGNAVATAQHGVPGDNIKRSWHMHIEMVINISQNGGPYYKWKYNSVALRSDPTITNNNIVFRETLMPPWVAENTEYPVVLTRWDPLSTVTLNYLRVCHIHP